MKMLRVKEMGLAVALVLLLCGCSSFGRMSTHSALVRVRFAPGADASAQLADYNRVAAAARAWAAANQMVEVPADAPGTHMHYKSTGDTPTLRQLHLKGTAPADEQWPVEAMLIYDPQVGVPWIDVTLLEGFRHAPSERLQQLYASLAEAMKQQFGARVGGKIW